MEKCANCEATIGRIERPLVFKSQVVCAACHARLRAEDAMTGDLIVVDRADPLKPKPKPPMFSVDRIDYQPIQRIKLVLFDPDTSSFASEVVELPNGHPVSSIAAAVERSMGVKVHKITVLQRYWLESNEMSGLMKGLLAVAVYGALTRA